MHPPSALAYDNQIALRVCVMNRPNRIYGTGQLSGNNVDMSWARLGQSWNIEMLQNFSNTV